VIDVEEAEADALQQHVDVTRRHDSVECENRVQVEWRSQYQPAERHAHQHIRYTYLLTRHNDDNGDDDAASV